MRNILAIAQKELKSYFASPIGYIAVGLFALLYGYFFVAILAYFVRQSMQMSQFGGAQAMNVNQDMIRPLLQDVLVLLLFVVKKYLEGPKSPQPYESSEQKRRLDNVREKAREFEKAGEKKADDVLRGSEESK